MTTENTTEKQKGVTTGVIFLIIMMFACLIISLVMCSGSSDEPETVRDEPKEAYDRVMLMTVTEDIVKEFLVNPADADFPSNSNWNISDDGETITVRSYVDATNQLGATVRENFTAKYSLPDVELISLEIGGDVVY
jgi:hypothetical protein